MQKRLPLGVGQHDEVRVLGELVPVDPAGAERYQARRLRLLFGRVAQPRKLISVRLAGYPVPSCRMPSPTLGHSRNPYLSLNPHHRRNLRHSRGLPHRWPRRRRNGSPGWTPGSATTTSGARPRSKLASARRLPLIFLREADGIRGRARAPRSSL